MPAPELLDDSIHLVDVKVIDQLKIDMGEDVDLVFEAFAESIQELIDNLQSINIEDDIDDLKIWTHSLKSSAASIGAMKLSAQSAYIEKGLVTEQPLDFKLELQTLLDVAASSLEKFDSIKKL